VVRRSKVNYMQKINQFARRLRSDKKGATAIEYGLLASLIAVAMITGVSAVGENLQSTFQGVSTHITAPTG